jgi:uncharacterized membrane protein YqjE
MPENVQNEAPSMASLVGGIITDAQRLVRQEVALARREMQVELDKAKQASLALSLGLGCALLAAIHLTFMVVYLLHLADIPLWADFLIVGGILAIVGGVMLAVAVRQLRTISLVPPQTAETLQENVQWLQNQT